ncbi:acylphosphatase-1 isoform X1 [Nothobranchius furzeri]|uniref:Acylphosphatase n=2 Tax=Nothobranchius furzeri TaxID=105023 RepID=A0A1A8UR95_NOTFU|nr:acylphosphatase-1 isoform X1 [Nothobranchius furzeri]KAF7201913.1 transcript variant X1 [Nothobranchius furzeri]
MFQNSSVGASIWFHGFRASVRFVMSSEELISVDYEIFGRVQGVFFRKYTQAEGKKIGLVGWVQNTPAGTVQGQLQGQRSKVKQMQEWLTSTGSPKSHITKAEFKNEKVVDRLEHSSFNVVK